MKRLIILLLIALVLSDLGPALAQGPTETPAPTATSPYANLRITPTPFSITPMAPIIDTSTQAGQFADGAINLYRWMNIGHVIDFLLLALMAYFTIRYLFGLIKEFKGK